MRVLIGVALICLAACTPTTEKSERTMHAIDIQGHRGCRGLMPENSISGFLKALDIGVNTLEMDAVISKDSQVVISHEPFFSHDITLTPSGEEIPEDEERDYNLFQMKYEEIAEYDCGSKPHPRFPDQQKFKVQKPLLRDVIEAAESYALENKMTLPLYNIETKSSLAGDNLFHPEPREFVRLLVKEIQAGGIYDRATLQSFDIRTLQVAREMYPDLQLALLIGNEDSPMDNLDRLGFVPEIYSPYFSLVNEALMTLADEKGMQIIPWTLNETADIQRMIDLGVDGIISDYPDRVVKMVHSNKQ